MVLQYFQIKTEADNNECPHDDKPSTGMFPRYGEQILFPVYCNCIGVSVIYDFMFAVSDDMFSALSSSRGSVVS